MDCTEASSNGREKSLEILKTSLEGNDLEWHKGDEAIKMFGLETKSRLGLDCHEQGVLYT